MPHLRLPEIVQLRATRKSITQNPSFVKNIYLLMFGSRKLEQRTVTQCVHQIEEIEERKSPNILSDKNKTKQNKT